MKNINLKNPFIQGLLLGIGFIIINFFIPAFTIGIPFFVVESRFLIVVIVAPLVEELVFRYGIYQALYKDSKLSLIITAIVSAAVFAAFHILAYAGSFTQQGISSASGAIIGAGIFGLIVFFIMLKSKDITHGLIKAIVIHSVFNFWILTTKFVVIGGN